MRIPKLIFLDNMIITVFSFISIAILGFDENIYLHILPVILLLIGCLSIFHSFKSERNYINFYNVYYLVWLILIPMTSYEFPLMNRMTSSQWIYCLIGNCCFSLSIICSYLIPVANKKRKIINMFDSISLTELKVYEYILVITDVCLVMNLARSGANIFTGVFRGEELFPGYDLVVSSGCLSIFYLFQNTEYKKKKIFYVLTAIYFVLNILSGIRWNITLLIIMLASIMIVNKKNYKYLICAALAIVGIFFFANYYRRGSDAIQMYYVATGLYTGDISDFYNTEIIRYIGMCQRLITEYTRNNNVDFSFGGYTLFPFVKWFVYSDLPKNVWINGYNALNIIGYLWRDFGYWWPIAMFIWCSVMLYTYRLYKIYPNNSFCRYWWSVGFMAVLLSFYSYLHHYTYWLAYFPIFMIIIKLFARTMQRKAGKVR